MHNCTVLGWNFPNSFCVYGAVATYRSLRVPAFMETSFAPPLDLLAGLVKNGREAHALAALDCHAVRHEVVMDHMLVCCAHSRVLERLWCALQLRCGADPRLHAASVICHEALAAVNEDICALVAEADVTLRAVADSSNTLSRYAENNEELAEELAGEAAHVAAAKQQLWLVEESLVARIGACISTFAEAGGMGHTSSSEQER